jgi:hypothetical protein
MKTKDLEIKNYTHSRSFGFGYSYEPTGESAYSIKTPRVPVHTGTIGQIKQAIREDRLFQCENSFKRTAWFYRGQRIVATYCFGMIDPEIEEFGVAWFDGFHLERIEIEEGGTLKIRVVVEED